MNQDEKTVLTTLAYYHALRVPGLTLSEIFHYRMPFEKTRASFYITQKSLQNLLQRGTVVCEQGYYGLLNFGSPAERTLRREESAKKRAILSSVTRFFPYIPYVRMVALTGSTALENASVDSDVDVLIMGANNRIWTTRLLVTLVTHLLGKRRYEDKIKDRVCLNHYITNQKNYDVDLLPTAHIYAQALPFWGEERITAITSAPPRSYAHSATPISFLLYIKRAMEIVLDYTIGPMVEWVVRKIQLRSINKKIQGKDYDSLELIISNEELRFHYPFSRTKDTLIKYNAILKGIIK